MFPVLMFGLLMTTALPTAWAVEVIALEEESVTLNITAAHRNTQGLRSVTWSWNGRTVVVYAHKFTYVEVSKAHRGRVEFDVTSFSLRLRNIQTRDSGVYKAQWGFDSQSEETVDEYTLSVLGRGSDQTLYVQEGSPVELRVQTLVQEDTDSPPTLTWYFNRTRIVTFHPTSPMLVDISQEYTARVELNTRTLTLLLKSARRDDTGLYTAGALRWTQYRLFVLEPVVAPNLTVVSRWSTNGTCNVTLTCERHDLSVTSVCNPTSCSHMGGDYANPTLTLSVKDDIITCNHSNQVSWKNSKVDMKLLCGTGAVAPPTEASLFLLIPVSLKALLISGALITRGLQ